MKKTKLDLTRKSVAVYQSVRNVNGVKPSTSVTGHPTVTFLCD